MQEMVVGDALEVVGKEVDVLLEDLVHLVEVTGVTDVTGVTEVTGDTDVTGVTAETEIADADLIDVIVMDVILVGRLATARKLVINANNGILNS